MKEFGEDFFWSHTPGHLAMLLEARERFYGGGKKASKGEGGVAGMRAFMQKHRRELSGGR